MTEQQAEYKVLSVAPAPYPGAAHIFACIEGADDETTAELARAELKAIIVQLATLRKIIDDQAALFGRIRRLAEMEAVEQKG